MADAGDHLHSYSDSDWDDTDDSVWMTRAWIGTAQASLMYINSHKTGSHMDQFLTENDEANVRDLLALAAAEVEWQLTFECNASNKRFLELAEISLKNVRIANVNPIRFRG